MAQFRSDKEKDKWKSLQNRAGTSIAKIAQGTASSTDLQQMSSTLGSLSKLAQSVFDDAVSSAEKQAKAVVASGNVKIKEGLTAFETAMNEAMATHLGDLLKNIREIVATESTAQTDDINRSIGSRFTDLQQLLPRKDLPTVDDILAANELLAERLESDDKWKAREDSLIDRIYGMFGEALKNVRVKIPTQIASSGGRVKGGRHVMNPYEIRSVADKGAALVGSGSEATGVESATVPMASGSVGSGEVVQLSPVAEKAIVDAGSAQEDFFKRLGDMLEGFSDKKESAEDNQDKETKKADTWWRSFKGFFGDKFDKAKKKVKDNMGWIKALGAGLLSMILTPQLWKTLADTIQEYVTWDNIKNAVVASYDFMKTAATDVVEWVWNKLSNLNLKDIGRWVGDVASAIWTKMKEFLKGPAEKVKEKTKEGIKTLKEGGSTIWQNLKDMVHGKDHSTTVPAAGGPKGGKDGSAQAAAKAVSNGTPNLGSRYNFTTGNTSIVNQGSFNLGGRTVSTADTNINYMPGVTAAPVGALQQATNEVAAAGGVGRGGKAQGTPQVGIGSFGFHSATDDTLGLVNSSFLGY